MPPGRSLDLLQGTLDLLVLKTLSWGPAHGYAIARWIEDTSGDAVLIEDMSRIIGIDLGTTNSCASVVEGNGYVKLIPYKGGDFTIPSIFAIDDKGNELIGHEAKRQWQLNPKNTVYASKRLIGRTFKSDVVETMEEVVAYNMREGDRNDVVIDVAKKTFHM